MLDANRGFGAANNAGLELVTEPVTVLVNPDVELLDDGLLALVAEAGSRDALVVPRLLNADGSVQDSAHPLPGTLEALVPAALPRPLLPAPLRRRYEPWRSESPRPVGWAIAACVAARTDLLRRAGPFDPAAFLFYEDLELCLRAAGLGRADPAAARSARASPRRHLGGALARRGRPHPGGEAAAGGGGRSRSPGTGAGRPGPGRDLRHAGAGANRPASRPGLRPGSAARAPECRASGHKPLTWPAYAELGSRGRRDGPDRPPDGARVLLGCLLRRAAHHRGAGGVGARGARRGGVGHAAAALHRRPPGAARPGAAQRVDSPLAQLGPRGRPRAGRPPAAVALPRRVHGGPGAAARAAGETRPRAGAGPGGLRADRLRPVRATAAVADRSRAERLVGGPPGAAAHLLERLWPSRRAGLRAGRAGGRRPFARPGAAIGSGGGRRGPRARRVSQLRSRGPGRRRRRAARAAGPGARLAAPGAQHPHDRPGLGGGIAGGQRAHHRHLPGGTRRGPGPGDARGAGGGRRRGRAGGAAGGRRAHPGAVAARLASGDRGRGGPARAGGGRPRAGRIRGQAPGRLARRGRRSRLGWARSTPTATATGRWPPRTSPTTR